MDYAVLKDGVVVNIAVADEDYAAKSGWVALPPNVRVGFLYADGQFVPPPEFIEAMRQQGRIERDRRLAEEVDPLVSNPLRWNAMTEKQQQAWADYRQALLDVPQQTGFPLEVIWPTPPA